tara:strand:+ start:39190 stop:40629 length:1440 start_codon:yes stop_codon:yes gene_type:complete
MSLKEKTINGVLWTFTDLFLVKGLSFAAMLFLARWLGPKDFGLIGMVAIFIAIGTTLIDSGLAASLIRTAKVASIDFSTVFYMNIAVGLLAYLLLYTIAPIIANFFDQFLLVAILRVYSLIFLISATTSVQLAILQKEMAFKKLTLLNVPSTLLGVTVGLFLGYNGYGVWSIVWMYLTIQTVLSLLLWSTASWRPNLSFSKQKLQQHFSFGYKLMLSSLLNTIFNNSYNVIIGKFFPVQILGFYERAQRFCEYPSMTITGIIEKVTYPMLARLQEDVPRLSNIYQKILKVTFFITAPLMLGASALAKPLFLLILGVEWLSAVPYFQILSLAYMLYPLHAFNLNVLKVFGRSDLFLKLEVIKKIIIVFGLFIGFQFGILGLLWGAVGSSFIALFVNMFYSSRLIHYSSSQQIGDMLPILISALLVASLMFYGVTFLEDYSNLNQIIMISVVGTIVYVSIYAIHKMSPLYMLLDLIKNKSL